MAEYVDSATLARLAEMMVSALDECSDSDLEQIFQEHGIDVGVLAQISRQWSQVAIVSHGKARFASAQRTVVRRDLLARPDISMEYDAMLSLVQAHIANDPHSSLTLAARNQNGALSEEELKSLVEDIASLKS